MDKKKENHVDTVAFRVSQLSPEARKELEKSDNKSKFIRDSIEHYVLQYQLISEKLDRLLQAANKNNEMISRLIKAQPQHTATTTISPTVDIPENEHRHVENELFNGLQAFDIGENGEQA